MASQILNFLISQSFLTSQNNNKQISKQNLLVNLFLKIRNSGVEIPYQVSRIWLNQALTDSFYRVFQLDLPQIKCLLDH